MIEQKIINSVFPGYKTAKVSPSKKIDTISGKFLGERALVHYKVVDAEGKEHAIVLKRKNSLVVPFGAAELSPNLSTFLKVVYAHRIFGFNDGQKREKLFYEKVEDSLKSVLPNYLGAFESCAGRNVILVMDEFPEGRDVSFEDLYKVVDLITDFHAKYFRKKKVVLQMKLNHYTPEDYRRARRTLRALLNYYRDENEKIYGKELFDVVSNFIENIDKEYMKVMDRQTLTHNDLTPRNIFVDDKHIIIYDWELVCFQNPEHDLVELLFTTVDDKCTKEQIRDLIDYFRKQISKKTQCKIDDAEFKKVLRFNALEYCVNRLAIYRSYSKKNQSKLAKRVERNMRKVLEACL